jgi:hypothetical protein
LLALPRRWHVPVVFVELVGGIALGPTGFGLLRAHTDTFTFLANLGFALVMFVAGSHVPVREGRLRPALRIGVLRALDVSALAALLGVMLAKAFSTGHARCMRCYWPRCPPRWSFRSWIRCTWTVGRCCRCCRRSRSLMRLTSWRCPWRWTPRHAERAALGSLAMLVAAALQFVVLRHLERSGHSASGAPDVGETQACAGAASQPTSVAALAAAQLGVPVAVATIGSQSGLLADGEAAALLLGATLTIAVALLAGSMAARADVVDHHSHKAQPTTRSG